MDNNEKNEENIIHDIYKPEKEQNKKFKILFEKYLLSFHNELLKYLPIPYDYIFMFVLGYLFMRLFTKPKNRIHIKQKKKLIDINVFQIEQKIREITNLQEKLNSKNIGGGQQIQNEENLAYLSKEKIDLEKLDEIEKKIIKLMEDLCERNKENSVEKSLQNNIFDYKNKILDKVNKQDEDDDEGEEEEDNEKDGKNDDK